MLCLFVVHINNKSLQSKPTLVPSTALFLLTDDYTLDDSHVG